MESRVKLLGHPVHPMLVMFPVALLITGTAFDLVDAFGGSAVFGEIAFWNITIGIIVGLVAAAVGSLDLASIPRRTRAKRVGLLHASINVAVLLLFAAVWALRVSEDRYSAGGALVAIEVVALAGLGVSGWLGGELVDRLGVGVDNNANVDAPSSLRGPVPAATEREGRPLDRDRGRRTGGAAGNIAVSGDPAADREMHRPDVATPDGHDRPRAGEAHPDIVTGDGWARRRDRAREAAADGGDGHQPTGDGQHGKAGDGRGADSADEVRHGATGIAGHRRGGGDGTRNPRRD